MTAVPLMESPPGPEVVIDGRRYRYFGGTSYFGLHGHPEVIEAGCGAFRKLGVHTATTRAGFGNCAPVIEVERRAADMFGRAAAFYLSSGYVVNHVLVQSAARTPPAVFVDESAHYSLWEAAKLTGGPPRRFQARDPGDLSAMLRTNLPPGCSPLVMTDAVAPATGVLAPVLEYLAVLREFAPATLLLDDAHGVGVLGAHGRGTLEHLGLWDGANDGPATDGVRLMSGGTLAKALGGFGGVIAGSESFVAQARASSHYFDGASAPPAPIAAASAKALELVAGDPSFRKRLAGNSARLRAGLRALGLDPPESPAAQTGVAIGDAANMRRLHMALRDAGQLVPAVGAYAGVGPQGVMRFAVCSGHTHAMIDELLGALRQLL